MPCVVSRETSVVPVVFLGLATVFLILSCVSAPLLDGVRLFRLHANIGGAQRYVDFGIWGYCVVPIRGLRGFDPSVVEGCSPAKLGYTIGGVVTKALHTSDELQNALPKAHTSALVLFPIATVFTALALLTSTAIWVSFRSPGGRSAITPARLNSAIAVAALGTLIAFLAFAVALNVVVRVKNKVSQIQKSQGNLDLRWESIIWLSALATLAHIYNLIFVAAMRDQRKEGGWQNDEEAVVKKQKQKKPKQQKQKAKQNKGKKVCVEEERNDERRSSVSSRASESDRGDGGVAQGDAGSSRGSVASGQKISQ